MPREFLGANASEHDVFLQNPMRSPFVGARPEKFQNMFVETAEFRPSPAASFGNSFTFEPQRTCDLMGKIELKLTLGALSSSGASGLYPRMPDYWPYHVISLVRIYWSSNHLQFLTGLQMYILQAVTRITENNIEEMVAGGLQDSPSQRYVNGQSSQTVYMPIPAFWTKALNTYLPYNSRNIRQPISIEITANSLDNVMETNGTTTSASLTAVLKVEQIFLVGSGQQMVEQEIRSRNADLDVAGYARMIATYERQTKTVANSTDEQNLVIDTLRRPCPWYLFVVRQDSDIATGIQSSRNAFGFQEISQHSMEALGRTVVPAKDHLYNKYHEMGKWFSADPSENIYGHSFSYASESPHVALGYLNFNAISQPQVNLTMPSTWATTGKADFIMQTYNIYVLSDTGDLRVMFS